MVWYEDNTRLDSLSILYVYMDANLWWGLLYTPTWHLFSLSCSSHGGAALNGETFF